MTFLNRSSNRPRPQRCSKLFRSSTGELQPVFDTMLENATRLCEAQFGNLSLCDGDAYEYGPATTSPAGVCRRGGENRVVPLTDGALGRVVEAKECGSHSDDIAD